MLYTAAVTVISLLISVLLALTGRGMPAAVAHLAFAVGIVPLIFGAMIHFIPVLTRSGNPDRVVKFLPVAAQVAGLGAVTAMEGLAPRWILHGAASLDFFAAALLLGWVVLRARRCLGNPHPGWRWYVASLGCLLFALLAVPPLVAMPDFYQPLRLFHLHLNTLGLVGMAALGTLPVLLPTVLGKPDPEAAGWLRRHLWPTLLAVFLIAAGAALAWPVAIIGAVVLFVLILGLVRQWRHRFGIPALWADGAASSLVLAALGLLILTIGGVLHGTGYMPARPSIAAWGAGFLLPLVTGALTQLLPVWRWPGPVTPARGIMRTRLAATGRWRGLAFLAAGVMLALGFALPGGLLAGLGMGLFALGMFQAMGVPASAR